MSKQNSNSGNGKTQPAPVQTSAQTSAPNPGEAQFRRETEEAMENDLMAVSALAPDNVAAKLAPATVPRVEQPLPEALQDLLPSDTKPPAVGATQILSMLHAGKIDVAEAERLLCALKSVAPAAQPVMPYIGDADGPATRAEIMTAIQQTYGAEIQSRTKDKIETMEVMAAMVEKVVRGLREPTEEEKIALARKKRDRARTIKEQLDMIAQQEEFQKMCPHERATADGKSHTCISALHNYIDNVLRGTCSLCRTIIEPGDDGYRQVIMQHNLAVSN